MNQVTGDAPRRGIHWWVRRFFFAWAILSTLWVANKMCTRGVSAETLRTSPAVAVSDGPTILEFRPARPKGTSALVFFCGAGVSAHAYAPLLRPVAEAGYPVFIIKLPFRFAPFDSHKDTAIDRAHRVIAAHPAVAQWVVSGHSLGGALAARMAHSRPTAIAALVLIGTTHPRKNDLSALQIPVTKVYASNDGVAPYDRIQATKHLLPAHTRWVEIRGGNHSQFGHYGHQLLDGKPTITRPAQQAITRSAILEALAKCDVTQPPNEAALMEPLTGSRSQTSDKRNGLGQIGRETIADRQCEHVGHAPTTKALPRATVVGIRRIHEHAVAAPPPIRRGRSGSARAQPCKITAWIAERFVLRLLQIRWACRDDRRRRPHVHLSRRADGRDP